jgi:hypothetical protein
VDLGQCDKAAVNQGQNQKVGVGGIGGGDEQAGIDEACREKRAIDELDQSEGPAWRRSDDVVRVELPAHPTRVERFARAMVEVEARKRILGWTPRTGRNRVRTFRRGDDTDFADRAGLIGRSSRCGGGWAHRDLVRLGVSRRLPARFAAAAPAGRRRAKRGTNRRGEETASAA